MANVHPLAVISPKAEIGRDVQIGPFCVIEDDVTIGDGCVLDSHVIVKQNTTIGAHNRICEHAVLGGAPQHVKAGTVQGRLEIGDHNMIREFATIHRGLAEHSITRLGSHNLVMVGAHIGHDCTVDDRTILANGSMLGGHVRVGFAAYISGAVAVHQFCHIGRNAMVGGQAHVVQDVPPYVTVDGLSSRVVGLNRIGLRRHGFTDSDMLQLKAAYRLIYRSGLSWNEVLTQLREQYSEGPAAEFTRFLRESQRGIVQERRAPRIATLSVSAQTTQEASRSTVDEMPASEVRKAG